MPQIQAYPGRVVFDHLAKTAGQAVNAWLVQALGSGCVTPNLIGVHQDLIQRYGGTHSVISAHVGFNGDGLDPRYRYLTLVREPLDRAVSWLFFVTSNHYAEQLPGLWELADRFIASNGEDLDEKLRGSIQNPYVEHFASVLRSETERSDQQKLEAALAVVGQYDVWGLYQEMPTFLADVAELMGIPAPAQLERINVTQSRPSVERMTPLLRQRLEALNALDLEFYRVLYERWQGDRAVRLAQPIQPTPTPTAWEPYNPVRGRRFAAPGFTLLSVGLEGGSTFTQGQILCFQLEFSLESDVEELEIGIHIWDGYGRWAFGTNTTLLERQLRHVRRGTHRMRYYLVADLPDGPFTAGFAFADRLQGGRELAWFDKLVSFQVNVPRLTVSVGYTSLPVDISYYQTSDQVATGAIGCYWGDDKRLSTSVGHLDGMTMCSTGQEGFLLYGPYLPLPAGRYVARLQGSAKDAAGLWMDVCADKGSRVLARFEWVDAALSPDMAVLPFELTEAVEDLEVRVWVTATANVRVDTLWIEAAEDIAAMPTEIE